MRLNFQNSFNSPFVGFGGGASSPYVDGFIAHWDASDESSITETSGNASQLNDLSGNDYHATATGSQRPTTGTRTQNSLNVLDFNGSSNVKNISYAEILNTCSTTDATVFVVGQTDLANDFAVLIGGEDSGGSNDCYIGQFGSGRALYWWGGGSFIIESTGTIAGTANIHVLRKLQSTAAATAWINGTLVGSDTMANDTITHMYIGGNDTDENFLDGWFGEALIYPTFLSDADINTNGNALANKWGISYTDI